MTSTDVCCFYTMVHFLAKVLFLTLLIFIYCEFLVYYFVLLGCSWPQLSKLDQDFTIQPPNDPNKKPLHVMFVADTHLLGSREGHWFDKLRREWQMYRSFQSAQFIFEPNIIIFLGDLTDEGQWCSDPEWNTTIQRFHSIFSTSSDTRLYVLAGNHDVGFHYAVSDGRLKRFEQSFQAPHVRLITIDDDNIHFVLINSMAFEGDQCRLCQRAENELNEVANQLNRTGAWTKPILLSHFPLYRMSDVNCSQWPSTSLQVNLFFTDVF
jgi:predicted MPP superfamily phosphohydrolase